MTSKSVINNILLSILIYIGTLLIPLKEFFSSGFIVYAVTIILVLIFLLNNGIQIRSLIVLGLLSLVFLFDASVFGYHEKIFSLYINFLKFGFLYYWFTTSIKDVDNFFSVYYKVSLISLVIILTQVFILKSTVNYMSIGVDLSYISVAVLYKIKFLKGSIFDKTLIVFILIFCMIYANRMSSLTIVIMCLITIYYDRKLTGSFKRILQNTFLLSFFLIIWSSYEKIIYFLWNFLISKDINSYSLFKLKFMLDNKNLNVITSGREDLYSFSIQTIKNNYFLPVGFGYFSSHTEFEYPHNVILELLLDFGFLGIFIFIGLLIVVLVTLSKSDKKNKFIILLFLSFSLSRLFVSSSFWLESSLWIVFGFVTNNRTRRIKIDENIDINRKLSR